MTNLSISDHKWFYSYKGFYYGNALTSINDKINNKKIINNLQVIPCNPKILTLSK